MTRLHQSDAPSVDNNVVARLRAVAARTPDRAAFVFDSIEGRRQITFAELWDSVDRAGTGLRARGLSAGDRAIVMVPMSIELYTVLLGVLKVGAAAVFVDPWIGVRQVAAFAAFAEPTAFLGIAKSHWLRQLERRLRRIKLSVTTGRRFLGIPARHTLAELLETAGDGDIHAARPSDPALITFTSGSSGTPKGSNRTHQFLLAQHEALSGEFPYADSDVDMPMFPVFALNNLATGITSIVPDIDFRRVADCDGAKLLAQIRREQVTTVTASPPFFDRLAEACSANTAGADNATSFAPRRLLTGGAPVRDDQLRRWQATWPAARIEVVYGSTEAEPVAHIEAGERLEWTDSADPRAGYLLGRPADCVRWRIVKITKGPIQLGPEGWGKWLVAPPTPGELVVAGAHVGRDYFRNPEATAENKILDADGTVWHRMGDTVYADAAGMLRLVGRVHSTIMRRGTHVHPQLLEAAARADDGRIKAVAAIGLPDAALGEAAVIVVQTVAVESAEATGTPTTAAQAIAADVLARLREAGFPVDRIVVTARPLPVDPRHNSKIDYPALRSLLAEGKVEALSDLSPPSTW
jgi:acyl-CoA synthetase (AMP-forming)/AMP-acid ligase II